MKYAVLNFGEVSPLRFFCHAAGVDDKDVVVHHHTILGGFSDRLGVREYALSEAADAVKAVPPSEAYCICPPSDSVIAAIITPVIKMLVYPHPVYVVTRAGEIVAV